MPINTKCSNCGEEYSLADDLLGRKAKCKVCSEEFIITDESLQIKKEKRTLEKSPDLNIKPNKISFILFSNPLIIILDVIILILLFINIYAALGVLVLNILIFAWENIKYKKEKYKLTDRKIIFDNGSLISDNSTEINLDKITEVKANLPFLQHLFFKTGNLYIKTAGAGTSQVKLSSIDNTLEIYKEMRTRMQKNGFHLRKEKLVQSEKPHMLGVIGEVFGKIIGALFFVFYIFIGIISETGLGEDLWILSILPIIALIGVVAFLAISYLDLRRRKYEIYADSVWYSEGFLSKHYAFVPMEVVSDVENTQSFFSKIFGLHDIIISSSGASNKVVFKNMVNGEAMIKNLRYLKDHITMSEKDTIEGEVKSANSLIGFKDKIEEPLDFDKDFDGHYKMNIAKTLFEMSPILLFFIPLLFIGAEEFISAIPVIIVIGIGRVIKLIFTDYNIRKTTIEKKFELFSTKFNSFTIEKITGVQIKQSFVDKWFGTCSVKFWSIGSGTPITFENIKKTKGLEEQILAKVGIRKEEKISDIETDFNFTNFVKANILGALFMIILFPITIIVFIYKKIFFAPKRYLREIYKNYIKTQNGIFFITKKYVLFRHIKGIKSTKFPLTNTGKLFLNVAGEVVVDNTKNNKITGLLGVKNSGLSILSNSVKIDYIKNVFESHNKLDNILNGTEINTEKFAEAKQDIINSILGLIIVGIIFSVGLYFIGNVKDIEGLLITLAVAGIPVFGIIVFLSFVIDPIIFILFIFIILLFIFEISGVNLLLNFSILLIFLIFIKIWLIKMKYWILENDRIVHGSGIIYKKRQTILYHRFNFIDLKRGFLNKMFKNGSVNIYTLGSSSVDMTISNIDNYSDIYEKLKKD